MSLKKSNRHIYLTSITIVALLLLLATQIVWTVKSAEQERNNFAQLASIAVTKAQNEIIRTYPDCCLQQRKVEGMKGKCKMLGEREYKMDSIINKHLEHFALNLDYTFVIQSTNGEYENTTIIADSNKRSYQNSTSKDSPQLRIEFPNRNQFLIRQMQGIFLSSIAFIAIIFIAFIQLLRLLRQEKQKYADTENFVNNMVHEFQTPISNIKLGASMLSKKINNPSLEINKFIEIIQSENERLRVNTIQILDLNTNFDCDSRKEIIDIHDIINHCLSNYQNHDIEFKTDFTASNHTIYANPNLIAHLITNLLDNAIKYSKNEILITIITSSDDSNFNFQISDNGIGIEKENLKRIFEKYFRVNDQTIHNIKGFGLGLAFVKQIAESIGGSIKVESKINIGSTFFITLPLVKNPTV